MQFEEKNCFVEEGGEWKRIDCGKSDIKVCVVLEPKDFFFFFPHFFLFSSVRSHPPLFRMRKAVGNDDAQKLETLLKKGGSCNETNKKGESLLMHAVDSQAEGCLSMLLEQKDVKVLQKSKSGDTVFHHAVKNGAEESLLEMLLNKCPQGVLELDEDGMTAFHWAIKLQEVALLEVMVQKVTGGQRQKMLTQQTKEGLSGIHMAVLGAADEMEVVDLLLECDAKQLELTDKSGKSPLLVAAKSGNQQVLQHLLEKGANVNAIDAEGKNLIHIGSEFGEIPTLSDELMQPLLMSPALDGNTPLHLAALNGEQKNFAELIKLGASDEKPNLEGKTPVELLKHTVLKEEEEQQKEEEAIKQEILAEREKLKAKEEAEFDLMSKMATVQERQAQQMRNRRRRAEGEEGEEYYEEEEQIPASGSSGFNEYKIVKHKVKKDNGKLYLALALAVIVLIAYYNLTK
jgi:ankyrin